MRLKFRSQAMDNVR